MNAPILTRAVLLAVLGSAWLPASSHAADDPLLARGKYLVQIAGCNDCHTAGYLLKDGKVPEAEWLKGDSFGWRGPWGTTYAPNLRLYFQGMTEAQWMTDARTLKRRPPMPWYAVNILHDDDLRAIYRFTRSLGAPGPQAPAYLPPEKEPPMPYALFPPAPPEGAAR